MSQLLCSPVPLILELSIGSALGGAILDYSSVFHIVYFTIALLIVPILFSLFAKKTFWRRMRAINLKQASILKRKQRRCEPINTIKKQDHFSFLVVLFFYGKKTVLRSRHVEIYEMNIQK